MEDSGFIKQSEILGKAITRLLDESKINKIARTTGFMKRMRIISGFNFLKMLIYSFQDNSECSFGQWAADLCVLTGKEASKQSVSKRFSKPAVGFLKTVLAAVIEAQIGKQANYGNTECEQIRIKDSTSFQLPPTMADDYPGSGGDGSEACARIQFEFDLLGGKVLDLDITPFNKQDMSDASDKINSISHGELVIRDLGYIKIEHLEKIQEEQQAYFINRLHSSTCVFVKKNGGYEELDFCKIRNLMKQRGISCTELEVYLGKTKMFKTKMVAELLPEEKYKQRLMKTGKKTSKNKKARMALNLFITNTAFPAEEVRRVYSLRWQIELMFKTWKSTFGIHKMKKMKKERFEAFLYARLIWIMINWHIVWPIIIDHRHKNIAISIHKIFGTLYRRGTEFLGAAFSCEDSLSKFIMRLYRMSARNHLLEKRKGAEFWSFTIIASLCKVDTQS